MTELSKALSSAYDAETVKKIEAGFTRRLVSLRVNSLRCDAETAEKTLEEMGIYAERVPWYGDALVLPEARESALQESELYCSGKIYLQNLSSMLPPLILAPEAGESILDMAAAPGGKTCELYALSGGKALITACERDKFRFERLKFNLQRQGATRVAALCTDALQLDDFLSFDKILLDAPCTGSGTVTPEGVRFSEAYLAKCVRAQEKLLRKGLKLLRRGGTLVYSTCSVLPAENGALVARITRETGAAVLPIAPPEVPLLPAPQGMLAVCPTERYEGFFVAKLIKE